MKRLTHPITVLTVSALPFVLYSFWRTGYQVEQLFDLRLFGTRYLWPILLLSISASACCLFYSRYRRSFFGVCTGIAVGVYLASLAFEQYPTDYKLWIYIVAPTFVWSVLACLAALLFFGFYERRA